MAKLLEEYLKITNGNENTKRLLNNLVETIPKNSKPAYEKVIEINHKLDKLGFIYSPHVISLDDVLKTKSANCLSKPLLIGGVLDKQNIPFNYELAVNIQDSIFEDEKFFLKEVQEKTDYNNPKLSTEKILHPIYRFAPIEHLRIKTPDGKSIETTMLEESVFGQESSKIIDVNGALSMLHKDLAVDSIGNEDYKTAKDHIKKSIKKWGKNREAHSLKAFLGGSLFDDKMFNEGIESYSKLKGNDSLYFYNLFLLTEEKSALEKSLEKYPRYANAIASKASIFTGKNPRESRYLYSIASQLISASSELSLGSFYVQNYKNIEKLYGKEKIVKILDNFKDEQFGNFDYHFARFSFEGNEEDFFEAESAAQLPVQKFILWDTVKNTKLFNSKEFENLVKQHKDSKLFLNLMQKY